MNCVNAGPLLLIRSVLTSDSLTSCAESLEEFDAPAANEPRAACEIATRINEFYGHNRGYLRWLYHQMSEKFPLEPRVVVFDVAMFAGPNPWRLSSLRRIRELLIAEPVLFVLAVATDEEREKYEQSAVEAGFALVFVAQQNASEGLRLWGVVRAYYDGMRRYIARRRMVLLGFLLFAIILPVCVSSISAILSEIFKILVLNKPVPNRM